MNSNISTPIRCSLLLLISVLLVAGCSSSSDSNSPDSQSPAEVISADGIGVAVENGTDDSANDIESVTAGDTTSGSSEDVTPGEPVPESLTTSVTRVVFDITVPAFVSNQLQVRVLWGNVDTTAAWVADESWALSADFATNSESRLIVSFNDRNGAITLGSFEHDFRTGTNSTESFRISANQFDTNRWDDDGDGISNIDELAAGTDPLMSESATPLSLPSQLVQTRLQLVPDKTISISWQPSVGTQYYRVLENPDGISGFTLISDDLDASIQQFDHRVALFNRINARYIVQACNANGCVDSGELLVPEALEEAIGFIKASNAEGADAFGDVISLSADGNTLAVAAPSEDSGATGVNGDQRDNSAADSGAVYVFVRNNGTWEQQAYLKASNAKAGDAFGWALTLSADGDTLAVGVPNEDSPATGVNGDQTGNLNPPTPALGLRTFNNSGAAYVFVRTDSTWQQQAYLKASNTRGNDSFGHALSLSGDGNTLAVGAPDESSAAQGVDGNQFDYSDGAQKSGAVYVFERANSNWQQQAYLKETVEINGAWTLSHGMGEGVSLSDDGSTLAAGGTFALIVFTRGDGDWQQEASLMQGNRILVVGSSLSISANGDTVAIGSIGDSSNSVGINPGNFTRSVRRAGAVYLFERDNSTWQQQAFIKASNTGEDDLFGVAVSLSADGNTLAVGASGEDSLGMGFSGNQSDNSRLESGAVYLFKRNNDNWQQQNFIKAINSWGDKRFAQVSLSADGETLAVGAGGDSSSATGINGEHFDGSVPGSGAVLLY